MRPGGGWHVAEMISVWFFASKRSSAKSNVLAVVTRWNTPAIDSTTDLNGAHEAPDSATLTRVRQCFPPRRGPIFQPRASPWVFFIKETV